MATKLFKKAGRYLPLISGFKATDFFKAFVLNSLVIAVIAALSIETRLYLGREGVLWAANKQTLAEATKFSVTLLTSFLIALLVYHIMYIIFGYGAGMLVT